MDSPNELPVFYTNAVNIRVSLFDILMECGKMYPKADEKTNDIKPEFIHEFSIFMSPQHFKELVIMFNKQLETYEKKFGKINEPPMTK